MSSAGNYKCPKCGKGGFASRHSMQRHVSGCANKSAPKKAEVAIDFRSPAQDYRAKGAIKQPVSVQKQATDGACDNLKCPFCGFVTKWQSQLERHKQTKKCKDLWEQMRKDDIGVGSETPGQSALGATNCRASTLSSFADEFSDDGFHDASDVKFDSRSATAVDDHMKGDNSDEMTKSQPKARQPGKAISALADGGSGKPRGRAIDRFSLTINRMHRRPQRDLGRSRFFEPVKGRRWHEVAMRKMGRLHEEDDYRELGDDVRLSVTKQPWDPDVDVPDMKQRIVCLFNAISWCVSRDERYHDRIRKHVTAAMMTEPLKGRLRGYSGKSEAEHKDFDTFGSALTTVRDCYLGFNLYGNEREEALVLMNQIVSSSQNENDGETSTAMKALHNIVERSSFDFAFRAHCGSSSDMVKLREQLLIIWELFLKMNVVDQEQAQNLLKELSEEGVSTVMPLSLELLTKMAVMLGGQNSENSFFDRVRLADTCRVMHCVVSGSIKQMPERVMMITVDLSNATINGVRVSNTLQDATDRIGALVAFGQPTTVVVRPMLLCSLTEDYPLLMLVMTPLMAGVHAPVHWLSSSAAVHLCCDHSNRLRMFDLLNELNEASRERITSICCADHRLFMPRYNCLLSMLPNCRKIYVEERACELPNELYLHLAMFHGVYWIENWVKKCECVEGHRGKTFEVHIRVTITVLQRLQQENRADITFFRGDTRIRLMYYSPPYCSFNCTDLLQHRL